MELALSEQLREKHNMEKKLQKLAKTLDYMERAKREDTITLFEAAFQRRLVEEKQNIELSKKRHDGDVGEKNRLARMLDHKMQFQERVMNNRQAEYNRLRAEREERINQILLQRRQEREYKRKMTFYLRTEDERMKILREEEETRKREDTDKHKKQEAERRAKLHDIAEKQAKRQEEVEEQSLRREADLQWGSSRQDDRQPSFGDGSGGWGSSWSSSMFPPRSDH